MTSTVTIWAIFSAFEVSYDCQTRLQACYFLLYACIRLRPCNCLSIGSIFVGPQNGVRKHQKLSSTAVPGHVVVTRKPAHKHSTQHVIFSGVTLRKTCAMWTLKWGAKSGPRFGVRRIVFSFRGPQNGVQILGPILRSTLPVFFAA